MSKVSLILSDIDGTLVPVLSDQPTTEVIDCVAKIQSRGIEIAPATGRHLRMAKDTFMRVGIKGMAILDGGASIQDIETGDYVWKKWIDKERAREIVRILQPTSTVIDWTSEGEVDATTVTPEDVVKDAPYVFAFVKEIYADEVIAALNEIDDLNVHIHYPHEDWKGLLNLQITTKGADKQHAAQELQRILNVTADETVAIGDSDNDLPLFRAAGVKIAMGNGIDQLKELADFVTDHVDENGFVTAMKKYVLTDE